MGRKDISECERCVKTNRRVLQHLCICFTFFMAFVYVLTATVKDKSVTPVTDADSNDVSSSQFKLWGSGANRMKHLFESIADNKNNDDDVTFGLYIMDKKQLEQNKESVQEQHQQQEQLSISDLSFNIDEDKSVQATGQNNILLPSADNINIHFMVKHQRQDGSDVNEEKINQSGEGTTFWPLPARITPKNPNVFADFRTKTCSYFCSLVQQEGYKESKTNPYRELPEFLFVDYRSTKYSSLKGAIINQVGRGSSCIGGPKAEQLRCREEFAEKSGCSFSDVSVQPPQWNIQNPQRCREFYQEAEKPERTGTIWIAKPGGLFHGYGKGITIHDSISSLQKQFGTCKQALAESVIIQEYVKDPALMGGHKFDLRSYLLIASTDPFIVFYHDGFVRRAGHKYSMDTSSLKDGLAHITNSRGQSSENHFFSFAQLQEVLTREHGFKRSYMSNNFTTHAMRTTNFLFNSAYNRTRGLIPTPGRFQLFALDWMIDRQGDIHLLEANRNPVITHYEGINLTPGLWKSMLQLEKLLHISPEKLKTPLSVVDGFTYKGWKLVYNQVEVEATGENFEACKYVEYIKTKHPLYSYFNFAEHSK